MSRGFPADTRSQKVLEEVYEKETISQLNWFLKCQEAKKLHGSEPLTATVINDTPLPDISNILSKSNKQQIEKDKEEIEQSKQTDSSEKKETQEETAEQTFDVGPDMIPPSPDVLKLLYEGISTEGKGRYRYLRDRCKLNVEDRFQYPILSSMEYGWGHADLISKSNSRSRRFGRSCVIEDSFYRRTGIPIKHGAAMLGLDKYNF